MPETRNWHSDDQHLRDHGWKIHSRPRSGEAIWIKKGAKFPQSMALYLIQLELNKK